MSNYLNYFLGAQVLGWLAAVLVIAGGLTWLLRKRLRRPGRQALFFLFVASLGLVIVVTLLREPWLGACRNAWPIGVWRRCWPDGSVPRSR